MGGRDLGRGARLNSCQGDRGQGTGRGVARGLSGRTPLPSLASAHSCDTGLPHVQAGLEL